VVSRGGAGCIIRNLDVFFDLILRVDPPFDSYFPGGGWATYARRGEFDAPKGSLNTPARHLSAGGALRVTASSGHPSTRHRYASREVVLASIEGTWDKTESAVKIGETAGRDRMSARAASAVNVTAVDHLAVLIEPFWGRYAFLHKLIESRLHCFFDLVPHPVRVRVELGLHSLPLFVVRQHVHPRGSSAFVGTCAVIILLLCCDDAFIADAGW
jgi:hypothetical protein